MASSAEKWIALACGVAAATACMPQSGDEPESSAKLGTEQGAAVRSPSRQAAPNASSVTIRKIPGGYEIEVVSTEAFPPSDITPVLRIAGVEFPRPKESLTHGFFGLVFTLTDAQFDALPDGSAVEVGYGSGSHPGIAFQGKTFGSLDKNAVRN